MPRRKPTADRKGRKSSFGCVDKLRRRDGTAYENWFARWVQGGRRVQRGAAAVMEWARTSGRAA